MGGAGRRHWVFQGHMGTELGANRKGNGKEEGGKECRLPQRQLDLATSQVWIKENRKSEEFSVPSSFTRKRGHKERGRLRTGG